MIEAVRKYYVSTADQCCYDSGIGSITAIENQGSLGTLECGNFRFKKLMQLHGT
jgi:hypothetical protein